MLDLGYPGGPKIAKLAESGNPHAYALPRPMASSKDFHFSYSGLKTAVLYLIRDLGGTVSDQQKADIAASFQQAAIDVLIIKTRRAIEHYRPTTVLVSGGVSANTVLRQSLQKLADEHHLRAFIPPLKYTTDNAAMIAAAGYFAAQTKKTASQGWDSVSMNSNLRL
jgi:N6-L-threonylcarbamoyladenine synthase